MKFFILVGVVMLVWTVVLVIDVSVNYALNYKTVYACSEVTKDDPPDVVKLCERLTRRKYGIPK
jgi:hypothetical protein